MQSWLATMMRISSLNPAHSDSSSRKSNDGNTRISALTIAIIANFAELIEMTYTFCKRPLTNDSTFYLQTRSFGFHITWSTVVRILQHHSWLVFLVPIQYFNNKYYGIPLPPTHGLLTIRITRCWTNHFACYTLRHCFSALMDLLRVYFFARWYWRTVLLYWVKVLFATCLLTCIFLSETHRICLMFFF
ncbi:hypothetical protein DFH27DRAFT_560274 [Peziza echinospora]|nr:hypothetical protein DFH27DRAFT_560274 [Peziza echinospora]